MNTTRNIKRIALALRLYVWCSTLLGIALLMGDIIAGMSDGIEGREKGYSMRHTLPVTAQQDSIWHVHDRFVVMGVESLTIREKADAPPLPAGLRVVDGLLTLGAFALLYLIVQLLRKSLALIKRFENKQWLQATAVGELKQLGSLFFATGLGALAWELLHTLYLRQAFAVPGYSHRFELSNDFSWVGIGLLLWGIAAVLQYTQELQQEQELTI